MELRKGAILIQTLMLTAISVVFITVLVNVSISSVSQINRAVHSEQAFQIAEAGIEYYRWHLAHSPTDYTNGTGNAGPYTIPYTDKEGNAIGEFVLTITPPPIGSTLVTIRSLGKLYADPSAQRTIQAKLAIPSFAKFAVVANDEMNFGPGTETFGVIHSNGGIRFDGLAHNLVSSAQSQYNDPDHSGQDEFGVHTHVSPVDPLPPAAVPTRTDVFMAGRQFPVPAVDFDGIIADLSQLKTSAQSSGLYFPSSGAQGYEVILNTNDTITVTRVTALRSKPNGCPSQVSDNDWGVWSTQSTTTVGTYAFPANGIIFFEDHLWISGKINTARLTIAAARFPDTPGQRKSIIVNNNLLYTNYDGQDVIGLISQNDIITGLYSDDNLRIDAALIAKTGRAGRPYFQVPSGNQQNCGSTAFRNVITLYGMIGTNDRYGYSWTCGGVYCSGYATRNIIYDGNLLFNPPPSFPLTSDEYQLVSWEEIK